MKEVIGLLLVLSLTGCATCKSTDSVEVCRTKERNRSQPHLYLVTEKPLFLMSSLSSL